MIATLLLSFALQQVQVRATIDRDEVMVGATLVLTITVEATGNEPVQILNPSTVGLEILGSSDQSDVSIDEGVATRVVTRTLRMRANAAGAARIGPTTVRTGEAIAQASAIEVTVVPDADDEAATLDPHIREMVERHSPAPHPPDEVFVEVLTSTDSVVLGEQLDLAVVAWFPAQVRAQLRTPPTLQPPELQGAWTYSHGVPHAVDMSRVVRGTRYQVYVHSVVVFPLTPGVLDIGPATVSYSLPMSYSFLSREVRHEPQSDRTRVNIAEQPASGRPASFDGAAGSNLRLSVEANPVALAVGDASVVTATITGRGNVALWPEPRIRWPDAIRVYPEGVEVNLEPDAELIAGSKTFRYLIVADSSGRHLIGQVSYPYYDLESRRYMVLRTQELPIVAESVTAPTDVGGSDILVLMPATGGVSLTRFVDGLPVWVWVFLALFPPLVAGLAISIQRIKSVGSPAHRDSARTFDSFEQEFLLVLHDLVGAAANSGGAELSAALRAAGVDAPIAAHAAKVRERIWQASYGPEFEVDPEELGAEAHEVLKALGGGSGATTKRQTMAGLALLVLCMTAASHHTLSAQTAERLYEAGALRAAADSFAVRANSEPWIVAHWYNLGVAWERAGEPERARRAWIRAARLAPRDELVRTALDRLPAQDIISARITRVSPITPAEAIIVAATIWILAWIGVGLRLRKLVTVPACVIALACAAYGLQVAHAYSAPVALVFTPEAPLRSAPYGPAQPRQFLTEGSAVEVNRIEGPWLLVERGIDRGWLLRDEVVALQ